MVRKILRSEAPQNDRGGEPLLRMTEGGSAAQNDGLPPFVVPRPTPFAIPRPTSFVILSEAKNLLSRLKDMARKILRRFRSSE